MLALVGSVKLSSSGTDEGRLLRAWLVASSIGALVVQYGRPYGRDGGQIAKEGVD
jgi:hypothetical protein